MNYQWCICCFVCPLREQWIGSDSGLAAGMMSTKMAITSAIDHAMNGLTITMNLGNELRQRSDQHSVQ